MIPVRILVVDDSALYRKILGGVVASLPDVEHVGSVGSGDLALKRLAGGNIDLVLLDIVMPEMSGNETLLRIRRDYPTVSVVMISGVTERDAAPTLKALADGALDFIPKPQNHGFEANVSRLTQEIGRLARLVSMRKASAARSAPPLPVPTPKPAQTFLANHNRPPRPELILIGVSTGGPRALQEVIPALSRLSLPPVLIVQHMPPHFTTTLAQHLDVLTPLSVREAVDGEPLQKGTILIAPGGHHLVVEKDSSGRFLAKISDAPPENSCRPSVDVLFQSAARLCSGGILTVILTGMGEDGATGVAAVRRRGPTWTIAQDEQTSVVYGMPQAIVNRQLADEVLPLSAIGPRIAELSGIPALTFST